MSSRVFLFNVSLACSLLSAAAAGGSPPDPIIGAELGMDQPLQQETFGALPRLAFGNGIFFAAWLGFDIQIRGTRVRASDGAILDEGGLILGGAPSYNCPDSPPSVASDGAGHFLVAFTDRQAPFVRAVRVRASDGAIVNSIGISNDPEGCDPAVAFGNGTFFVVWTAAGAIHGRRVPPDGSLPPSADAVFGENASQLAIAYGNGKFLTAWVEGSDVRAQRISATDGSLLDPASLAITQDDARQFFPAASFDGTRFLIAWSDERAAAPGVYGRRVSAASGALDASDTPLVTLDPTSFAVGRTGLAFDGASNYFVAWHDRAPDGRDRVRGRRVTSALAVLDGPLFEGAIELSQEAGGTSPAVAFGAGRFLGTWWASFFGQGVKGRRVTSAGTLEDAAELVLSTAANWQDRSAIARAGAIYLAAWNDSRRGPYGTLPTDLVAVRLQDDGTVLDPNGIVIAEGVEESRPRAPALATDGTDFLAVWNIDEGIRAARITATGSVVDTPLSFGSGGFFPDAGYSGGYYLVAWTSSSLAIRARRIDRATGASPDLSDIAVGGSQPPAFQVAPAIACLPAECLIVWFGGGATGEFDIWGARVRTSDGALLDPIPVRIGSGFGVLPAIATDGSNYLVAWSVSGDGRDLVCRRLDASAAWIDADPIPIAAASNDQANTSIAFNGLDYVVVWGDSRSFYFEDIWSVRITIGGVVLDDPANGGILISETNFDRVSAGSPQHPKIASPGGQRSLITYTVFDPDPPFGNRRIRARFHTGNR